MTAHVSSCQLVPYLPTPIWAYVYLFCQNITTHWRLFRGNSCHLVSLRGSSDDAPALTAPEFRAPGEAPDHARVQLDTKTGCGVGDAIARRFITQSNGEYFAFVTTWIKINRR